MSQRLYRVLKPCQRAVGLQTPTPNAEFTRRLYTVHAARSQRAHGALEDPTALPQRCQGVLSNTLWKRQATAFVLSIQNKRHRMAFYAIAQCINSVCTALLAFACSAHLGVLHFLNAVRTPLWCDRGLSIFLLRFSKLQLEW